jgi:hypothetical protein
MVAMIVQTVVLLPCITLTIDMSSYIPNLVVIIPWNAMKCHYSKNGDRYVVSLTWKRLFFWIAHTLRIFKINIPSTQLAVVFSIWISVWKSEISHEKSHRLIGIIPWIGIFISSSFCGDLFFFCYFPLDLHEHDRFITAAADVYTNFWPKISLVKKAW